LLARCVFSRALKFTLGQSQFQLKLKDLEAQASIGRAIL
jgi:hypothetical protein